MFNGPDIIDDEDPFDDRDDEVEYHYDDDPYAYDDDCWDDACDDWYDQEQKEKLDLEMDCIQYARGAKTISRIQEKIRTSGNCLRKII